MFVAEVSNQAKKFLKTQDNKTFRRIYEKIEELKQNPLILSTQTVKGFDEKTYKIRVGKYRILYEIDHSFKRIDIIKIDKRSRVYL